MILATSEGRESRETGGTYSAFEAVLRFGEFEAVLRFGEFPGAVVHRELGQHAMEVVVPLGVGAGAGVEAVNAVRGERRSAGCWLRG